MNWRKILRRTALFVGLLVAAIVVAGFLVLRSQWFERAMLVEIVKKAQAETGGLLNIQRWDLRLQPLTIELYGIVLHGSEPVTAQPLLQIQKLTVGVKLGALLDRKVQLSELLIEHPIANLIVSRDGVNNLPTPPTKTKSNTTVWTLAVGHISLTRGEIFYNNTKSEIDANLYNLRTQIHFDPALTQYSGSVSYQNGTLRYLDYRALTHSLEARFSATPAGATLDSLLLRIGSSQVIAQGHLVNYASPDINASYRVVIHTQDFSFLSQAAAPAGDLQIDGKMQCHDIAGQPLVRNLSADGTISSRSFEATFTEARVEVENLAARYRVAEGRFALQDLTADLIGGRLQGQLTVNNLENLSGGEFQAILEHASIGSARLSMRRADVRRMPVTGTVSTQVRGSWADSLKNIRVLGAAQVTAVVWKSPSEPKIAIPVDATAHLLYDGTKRSVTLRQTSVQVPAATAVINGEIGNHSDLRVHAVSGDLHRLAELVASLSSANSTRTLPLDVSGQAKLYAVVQGSLSRPSISGQISTQNLEVQGSRWKTAQVMALANPSEINISQASLVSARQGALHLSARIALRDWSHQPANAIHANVTAHDISLRELEDLGALNYPVTGVLSANISLRGSQLHPSGEGSLEIAKASAYNQPIQDLLVQFHTANDSIDSLLTLKLPAGTASGTLDFTPRTKAYNLNFQAPDIIVQKLQAVAAKNIPASGKVTLAARGTGTLEHPQLNLTVQAPTLQVSNTAFNGMNATINLIDRRAHLALNSNVALNPSVAPVTNSQQAQAYIRADASVDLLGDYTTQASIDTSRIPLAPFLVVYAPNMPEGFKGETEFHASLAGPLKNKSKLVAHLTIPTLTGMYQSLQFSNAAPIHADYADSVLVLQPAEFRGTQTSLRLQGRVPIASNAPISVNAQGSVNLQLLAMFDSDVQSRGTADFDIQATGNLPQPNVHGQIQIRNAGFTTSSAPVGLSKLNGTLDLSNNKIQITSLTGEVGGGEVSTGGSIALRPALQFNVALSGKNVRILYPAGVRSTLDADLTFTGDLKAAMLRGRTLLQSLNFTPDFNLSTVAAQFNTPSVPPLNQTLADNVKLAVSVQSSQNLTARSSQLTLSGMANLRIAGTVANPVVMGRVDLASGELFFMSNRYALQRGILSFNDPNQTQPVLNVQATTTIEQYNLTLTLLGPLDRLATTYVSSPALPTADIISLIYRGQTVEEAAATGTSTDSILASGVASQFSSGLRNLTGISSLQIDPLLGGNGTNPSARIAVQQRVTKDFLFTFSTDITQPESDMVLGQYQLTPRWSVNVERDQLGGISVMGQFRTKF
jgi:translocation and assembly module TamB